MSVKLVVLAAVVATCCAKPFYYSAVPELGLLRATGRGPSISYGIGSGFATDIGGLKQSNSYGASFQIGDGTAYGGGIASADGSINANGVGYAHTNPAPVAYRTYPYAATPYYTYPYNVGYNNGYNNYRSPLRESNGNVNAIAQNVGNFGNSIALSQNGLFGSTATAINIDPQFRNSGGTVFSSAVSTPDGSNAKSITQTYDGQGGINTSLAATEDAGGATGSTAHNFKQLGSKLQHSGATAIDAPGIQATNAINTGTGGNFY